MMTRPTSYRSAAPNCSTCWPQPFCPPHTATVNTSSTGRTGDATIKPAPAPATRPGTPTQTASHDHTHAHHELQLPWLTCTNNPTVTNYCCRNGHPESYFRAAQDTVGIGDGTCEPLHKSRINLKSQYPPAFLSLTRQHEGSIIPQIVFCTCSARLGIKQCYGCCRLRLKNPKPDWPLWYHLALDTISAGFPSILLHQRCHRQN